MKVSAQNYTGNYHKLVVSVLLQVGSMSNNRRQQTSDIFLFYHMNRFTFKSNADLHVTCSKYGFLSTRHPIFLSASEIELRIQ